MTYYEQHMEERKSYGRRYYAANKDKVRARYELNKESLQAYQREYARARGLSGAKNFKQYAQRHPDEARAIIKEKNQLKRALIRSVSDGTASKRVLRKLRENATQCAYCGVTFTVARKNIDHKQPLCLGGKHSLSNITVSCADCNNMKGAMSWEQWSAGLPRFN